MRAVTRAISILTVAGATLVRAQSSRLAFEVASIRPDRSDIPAHSNFPLNVGDMYTPDGGRFSAVNFPLVTYIFFAYSLAGNQARFLIPQLPAWVLQDRYDIEARAEGNRTKDEMRLMTRSLLADRFKFAFHTETREVPVLALVVAKPGKTGPQLTPHPADAPCQTNVPPPSALSASGLPPICNSILGLPPSVPGRSRLGGRNVTIALMADMFSQRVEPGRPIIDATGLQGKFDFLIEFVPQAKAELDPNGPQFEQALRDQLGSKWNRAAAR
jgi:uncharacterized protein (TIGR03435 family)